MSQARFFLFIAVPGDNPDLSVHRSLDEVRARWEELTVLFTSASALVHLGCARPRMDDVRVAIAAFPGRVLFSASTKWAVAAEYPSSERPVGQCVFRDGAGRREQRVFYGADWRTENPSAPWRMWVLR
jgi:hypothetical protein